MGYGNGFSEITVKGRTPIKEYLSPCEFEVPINLRNNDIWSTTELSEHICDKVTIEKIEIKKKYDQINVIISILIKVYTRPPKDRLAILQVSLKNDVY